MSTSGFSCFVVQRGRTAMGLVRAGEGGTQCDVNAKRSGDSNAARATETIYIII